jgi:hypothetical protein
MFVKIMYLVMCSSFFNRIVVWLRGNRRRICSFFLLVECCTGGPFIRVLFSAGLLSVGRLWMLAFTLSFVSLCNSCDARVTHVPTKYLSSVLSLDRPKSWLSSVMFQMLSSDPLGIVRIFWNRRRPWVEKTSPVYLPLQTFTWLPYLKLWY